MLNNFRRWRSLTVYISVMRLIFACLIFVATDYANKSTTKSSRFAVLVLLCVNFFAKNVQIESYSEKCLSGHLCGDRADWQVDMGRTTSSKNEGASHHSQRTY